MPAKKTGRGANLSLLNKEHPKDKKGDDDIGDLVTSVDKPDDSSSSGESTSLQRRGAAAGAVNPPLLWCEQRTEEGEEQAASGRGGP